MSNSTSEDKSSLLSALDDVVATLGAMPSLRIACEEGNYDLHICGDAIQQIFRSGL